MNYFENVGAPNSCISPTDLRIALLDRGFPADEQSVDEHIDNKVRTDFHGPNFLTLLIPTAWQLIPALDAYNGQIELGKLAQLYNEQLNYV